ncbi:hypothetical protein HDE68_002151 [Pedobacter cryoconitis]|uniref:Uncharacterized protein n=1 Tax=Pedobacter cryoconitis TaxID=188932 RepID=A0A7W9DYR2_9SPHI|nr:hypothetical protein [Pedobacter cryoconitis]
MIIYKGWGPLALLTPVCTILIGIFFFGTNGNASLEIFLYSLLCSAPLVYITGLRLNKKSVNDLYFIPLQYWGIAWGVISIAILLFRYIKTH